MDPISILGTVILPALVPALADGVRALVARFTGGAGSAPQNVAERIQLMQAEAQKLQALAALDAPSGNISRWVADLRASFRYLAVCGIVASTIVGVFADVEASALAVMLDLSGACMGFVIGERMYLKVRA